MAYTMRIAAGGRTYGIEAGTEQEARAQIEAVGMDIEARATERAELNRSMREWVARVERLGGHRLHLVRRG